MKIVIAPDSFKEALDAKDVCEAIARGVRRVHPDAALDLIPMADGGEGTVDALVTATGGSFRHAVVTNPLGEPVNAKWGILGDGTAVIEMAAASGLALFAADRRDPTRTTTYGTGELIRAALDADTPRILIGIGGSATNDGGTGAAQALGVTFHDRNGEQISTHLTGGQLTNIARIDLNTRNLRLESTPVEVACDVDNPLCGPRGAAAIYSPQKGATPEQVQQLDANLAHLADVIERDLGRNVRDFPGAGAAGGLGAGLVAFCDATIRPGVQLVMDAVDFARRIEDVDLIITGEGRIDRQSMMGKVIEGVGRAGKAAGIPVIALAGLIGDGADETLDVLESYHCINPPELPSNEALAKTAQNLEKTTAVVLGNTG
jgi:glycerate kinase